MASFRVSEPPHTMVVVRHSSSRISDKKLLKYQDIYQIMKTKRGEYLDYCLDTERALEHIICAYFFPNDKQKSEFFREYILSSEFFSFMQKKKVVESILITDTKLSEFRKQKKEKNQKDLMQEIHNIINDRNKFAHGTIYIDASINEACLEYKDKGTKTIVLDDNFFLEFDQRLNHVNGTLGKIKFLIEINSSERESNIGKKKY